MSETTLRESIDGGTEATPLLGAGPAGGRPRPPSRSATAIGRAEEEARAARTDRIIRNMLLLGNLMASASGGFLNLPVARLTEDVLCHAYYEERRSSLLAATVYAPIDEGQCKLEPIQSKLVQIIAVSSALTAAAGFLNAYPWSSAADRLGRKFVLSLSLAGIMLGSLWTLIVLAFGGAIPIRLVWLECLGAFIGGGNPVAVAMLLAMLADASSEEERAVVFLKQNMVTVCGNLVAPTLSSFMMSRLGPWPPYITGIALIGSSALLVLFIPDAKHPPSTTSFSSSATTEQNSSDDDDDDDNDADEDSSIRKQPKSSFSYSSLRHRLRTSLSIFTSPPSLVLLLLTCAADLPVLSSTTSFMALFISKRFGLRLFQGGYVQTAFGLASMAQSLVLLPWLCRFLMRNNPAATTTTPRSSSFFRPADEQHRDAALARLGATITVLAALVMGAAPTLALFIVGLALLALGMAYASLAKSLMSFYVAPAHRSRVFGVVGMVQILGGVYAQPMLAGLFSIGMRLGGGWVGLPYFGLAGLVCLVLGFLLLVRVPKRPVGLDTSSSSSSSLSADETGEGRAAE
ncbi:hypothetical protein M406DRAFT_107313 [Cryphonectria parasitica EP155]|uniref:Major facilitator superfamily (MFS) profile domain-containing protein n=1 Tax=Cryphonectria parasitica (strain ATCC 38755 / EP155) TaxID=660469 RepID=A0A9P5CNQ4_CRYP1|nr:uncharacterized protein M406DRAFT_107313 [Cryphonectria parasitica EP155]KAF3764361.1 hypothetical protein M406DRAFT_107313 [Cryphonectria parasitica EP155]